MRFNNLTIGLYYKAQGRNCTSDSRRTCGDWSGLTDPMQLEGDGQPVPPATVVPTTVPTTVPTAACSVTPWGTLSSTRTISDRWTTSSCTSGRRDNRYAKYYSFTLERQADIQIDLMTTTRERDTYLYLLNGHETTGTIRDEDDDDGPAYLNSRIIIDNLAAGDYTIDATTYSAGITGDFTLQVQVSNLILPPTPVPIATFTAVPTTSCGVESLGAVSGRRVVNATLTSTCAATHRLGAYGKYYSFHLTAPAQVNMTLTSTEYPFMNLLSGQSSGGSLIAADDAPGTGSVSRIARSLGTGWYTVEVTTYYANHTGDFALTLMSMPAAPVPVPTTPSTPHLGKSHQPDHVVSYALDLSVPSAFTEFSAAAFRTATLTAATTWNSAIESTAGLSALFCQAGIVYSNYICNNENLDGYVVTIRVRPGIYTSYANPMTAIDCGDTSACAKGDYYPHLTNMEVLIENPGYHWTEVLERPTPLSLPQAVYRNMRITWTNDVAYTADTFEYRRERERQCLSDATRWCGTWYLPSVLMHELGHTMGLEHTNPDFSPVNNGLMDVAINYSMPNAYDMRRFKELYEGHVVHGR